MTMKTEVFISIYLDTRRKKSNGKYPVKLRVFSSFPRKQKFYPTTFEFTEKEFESIWLTARPRNEYKDIRNDIISVEEKAISIYKGLTHFTFEKFEKKLFIDAVDRENVFYYYKDFIKRLKDNNQIGTSNTYELSMRALKHFVEFIDQKDNVKTLQFSEITPFWLERFEKFMTESHKDKEGNIVKEKSRTTVSIYLRALRSIFNLAIKNGEIKPEIYPFGKGKYQVPSVKKVKKALNEVQLKKLFEAKPAKSEQEKARDFWFFSFVCNGMNVKDIALLKNKDLNEDSFSFYREKTKRTAKKDLIPVIVYLNDFSLMVIKKYGNISMKPNDYVFPIINDSMKPEEKFNKTKNFTRFINQNVKKLATELGISSDISSIWGRHSFSTTAIRKGYGIEFVNEALNHSDLKTTQGYFAGFENETKRELSKKLLEF